MTKRRRTLTLELTIDLPANVKVQDAVKSLEHLLINTFDAQNPIIKKKNFKTETTYDAK